MRLDGKFNGSPQSVVVGRDQELARIGEMARRLATGRGGVITLLGERGLGKTAILEATIARASAIVENVRTVHVPGRTITHNAMATIAGVVANAVPVPPSPATRLVEKVAKDGVEVSPEDPDVLRATLDIARTATARRPLVVTVDNLPLSEEGVFPIFTSLAAAAASMPLLLVVTSSSVPATAQELSAIGSLWIHRLEPLTPGDAVTVVRQAAGPQVPRSVAAELGRLARGNPGDIQELCGLLEEDQLYGREPLPDPLPGTTVSTEVYRRWFLDLGPDQQTMVLCAAVFVPRSAAALETATGVPLSDVLGPDGRLLLRQEAQQVAFSDPRAASAVLAFTPQQEIHRAHELMSRAAEGDSFETTWGRLRAGLPVEPAALAELQQLAQARLEDGEVLLAGRLAREVRQAAPAGALRAAAALTHGVACYHAGHLSRAVTELTEAITSSSDPELRYRAIVPLVLSMSLRDRIVPLDVAEAGIAELVHTHPHHAASLAALVARTCATVLEVDAAEQYLDRAEQLAHGVTDGTEPPGSELRYELDLTRYLVNTTYNSEHLTSSASLFELISHRRGDDVLSWDLSVTEALLHLRTHRWQRARATLTDLRNRAQRYSSDLLSAQTALLSIMLHLAQWEVQAAVDIVDATEDRYPLHLPAGGAGQCQVARARVLHGQPQAAAEWLDRVKQLLTENPGPVLLEVELANELGLAALTQGDTVAAIRHYSDALAASGASAETLPDLRLGLLLAASIAGDQVPPDVAAALAAVHTAVTAEDGVPASTALARLVDAPRTEVLQRALAAVQAARRRLSPGQQAGVLAAAERALERLSPEEYADQVAALADPAVPADRDEHRAALLTQARDLFQTSGVLALVPRAEDRLVSLGPRPGPAGHDRHSEPPELTAQEQHIATLVANGASNKQVASTLFVSVRTVELRLTNVYRKLGIRSRRELRELMAQD